METPGKKKDSADWKVAELIGKKMITPEIMGLTFSLKNWVVHKPGQHYEIALTSTDGYRAARNYSIASEPEKKGILEFGIELLKDGEVSPYLFDMKIGDKVEVRGPLGGYFNWTYDMPGPLIVIGGGSGIVPLMCMLRHKFTHKTQSESLLITSTKTIEDIPYKSEIESYKKVGLKSWQFITRENVKGKNIYNKRIDFQSLNEILSKYADKMPMIYVCGPNAFVEVVSQALLSIGFNSHEIKTERFG